jgi:hypothetical protein
MPACKADPLETSGCSLRQYEAQYLLKEKDDGNANFGS